MFYHTLLYTGTIRVRLAYRSLSFLICFVLFYRFYFIVYRNIRYVAYRNLALDELVLWF